MSTPFKTKIERHPERQISSEAQSILQQGLLAHVGFIDDGLPYVIPMSYHYAEDSIYLHGSLHSRALQLIGAGAPTCIEISLLDGLVYSREAMFHSMNYRSVMAFGKGQMIEDPEYKQEIFNAMIPRYFEGRTAGQDYQEAPQKHLEQTLLVKIQLEAVSAKAREGGPNAPQDKLAAKLGQDQIKGSSGIAPVPQACPFHSQSPKGHPHV